MILRQLDPDLRRSVDPDDVLHDTYVRAFHSLQRFEWKGEGSFRSWLSAIAAHVTLDVVRNRGRRPVLQLGEDLRTDALSPSQRVAGRERLERLERALHAVRSEYRTVLWLSRIEGLAIKEIAARIQRSDSAVRNLLLRATRELRQCFGETESFNLGSGRLGRSESRDGT